MATIVRIPRLHDHHTHVSLYGALHGCPSLAGLAKPEAVALMRALPADRLSTVLGWHSGRLAFGPDELDSMPPIILMNLSLHGMVITKAARSLLSKTNPGIVEHHGDPEWYERHLPEILEFLSNAARLTERKLDAFMGSLERAGLGSAEDMLLAGEEAFQVIRGSRWSKRVKCWSSLKTFRSLNASTKAEVEGIKLFTDGALGTRTAALREAFTDGSKGLFIYSDEAFHRELGEAHEFRKPASIHAIGDRAIEQALTALERLDREGLQFPRVRLEHVQFISLEQARRAKNLGVILSMQPNFNSDSQDYSDRLAPHWLETNNPFRMLIDQAGFKPGYDLIFGSDGMPHGVEYALQWSLFPLYAGQRLSLDELVAGYESRELSEGSSRLEIDEDRRLVKWLES